jgi:nucleoside-diphosphate-sugar epimerase
MKVFVTGTDGYLGVLLAGLLRARGHDITGCDTGYYRSGWLYNGVDYLAPTLSKDIRECTVEDLQGHDAIMHLAELSNDPVGNLSPNITYDINHKGSLHLANLAREAGLSRFVYFSSCSVYGEADGYIDETGPVKPLTAYAKCKVMVENDVGAMASDDFSPTFLRNATAYGASPRQRFDIVVNNLAGWAYCTKNIKMESDGTPWRPLVHALDICKAAVCALEAPRERVHGEVFNVGDTGENYQVRDVASIIAQTIPGCELEIGDRGGDKRDYKVNFDKINTELPGFSCDWNVERGAQQLLEVFDRIQLTRELFESPPHTRLKQIRQLLVTNQIDESFFWAAPR